MKGIVQLSQLGRMGRGGNAIIQYIFGRTYARRHDLELQVPHWFGEEIWDFKDARLDRYLPKIEEKMFHGIDDTIIPHLPEPAVNWDLIGFFQYHTSYYKPDREFIREIFDCLKYDSYGRVFEPTQKLRSFPKTIGVHIRRGDFGVPGTPFYLTPIKWYLSLLYEIMDGDSYVFVASDDASVLDELHQFNAFNAAHLGIKTSQEILPGCAHLDEDVASKNYHAMDFFPDWWLLRNCDTLIIPGNSTFGFSAAMTSALVKKVYRSNPDLRGFEEIDIWDSMPSQMIDVKKYESIPGLYKLA